MKLSTSLLVAYASAVSALTAAQWRSQSIYQVLTDRFARTDLSTTATCNTGDQAYCGGTWQGIIKKLDYIQGMGFTAIWISPVVQNLAGSTADGSAYHGYWAQNIYALNSNFGTAADLKALSAALHARGMYLMVDMVTNHMGYLGCGTCVDYTVFTPFNAKSYYHDFCLIDYNNVTSIKDCWEGDNTVSLPDMRTENANVLAEWNTWVNQMVTNYTIDGIRLDSAQQVDSAFLTSFQNAAGVYIVGEVYNGDPAYTCPYQGYLNGVLNYPSYFWVLQAFESTSGSISNLVTGINTLKTSCADTTLLGNFLENHDIVRFPSITTDMSLAKNAIAFTMLQDGVSIIYEGQEQHYTGAGVPYDREAIWLSGYSTTSTLYTFIKAVNALRARAFAISSAHALYKAYPVYSDTTTIAMRKDAMISVFSNKGASGASYSQSIASSATGYSASEALIEVIGCTAYTTDTSGNLVVAMASGLPRIFYPKSLLTGSGICSSLTGTATTTSAVATSTSCTTVATVAVTFTVLETTVYGTNIYLVGSTTQLGSWAPASGVLMSASAYTTANPIWSVTLSIAAGTALSYKFVSVDSSGTATWEADPDRTYTVPTSCSSSTTVAGTWQ